MIANLVLRYCKICNRPITQQMVVVSHVLALIFLSDGHDDTLDDGLHRHMSSANSWSDNNTRHQVNRDFEVKRAASFDARPDKIAIPVVLLRASCMTA